MKSILPITSVLVVIVAGNLTPSTSKAAEAQAEPKIAWKIAGELEEACSCRAACPCWFKSLPSRMTCDGVQIVIISKGHYGHTSLDGLSLAQFVQSPERKSMFESFGSFNIDYVYLDEKADQNQRQALRWVAEHVFPQAAKSRQYRFVPITRAIEGKEHITKVGNYAVCSGHLIEGGNGEPPKIVNPPLADPTHKEYLQGETTRLTYKDAGQDWNYEKSNYMWNKFQTDNKEYERFEAEMAKKMAATK
jgi:hypothetical protein